MNLHQNQTVSRNRHPSLSYTQGCSDTQIISDPTFSQPSQNYACTPPQHNKVYPEFGQTQEYAGSGSHPSPAVRTLVANKILGRNSRSSSFDSDRPDSKTKQENTTQFNAMVANMTSYAEANSASVITARRHMSESELDKPINKKNYIPKTSSMDSFDLIQTSS